MTQAERMFNLSKKTRHNSLKKHNSETKKATKRTIRETIHEIKRLAKKGEVFIHIYPYVNIDVKQFRLYFTARGYEIQGRLGVDDFTIYWNNQGGNND